MSDGSESRIGWEEEVGEGKIRDNTLGNETFQKLRDDRKVRDWAIGSRSEDGEPSFLRIGVTDATLKQEGKEPSRKD